LRNTEPALTERETRTAFMIQLNHPGPARELREMRATRPALALGLFLGVVLGGPLGVLLAAAGPARPASAHAVLAAATPAPGAIVAAEPAEVRITFSEPVRLIPGRTQVIAPNGKRVNDGDPVGTGAQVRIALNRTDRPLGTYLVSYRVISADSHPVAGSFTFSVGAPSVAAPRPSREGAHPATAVAVSAARYVGYAGLALVAGPALLLATLWPRRLRTRAGPAYADPSTLTRWGFALLAAGTLAGLWLQAPYGTGAAPLDVSAVELREVLGSRFGGALLVRLALIGALAALLPRALADGRGPRRGATARGHLAVLGLALGMLVTWPVSGHAAASPRPPLSVVADVVHLAAMAVWLGGLVALIPLVRRADRRELGVILPVWSRWATLAVYWLVAGGVVQALLELGGPRTLLTTRYGQLILVKVGLLAAVLAVAAYSRRLVRRRSPPATDRAPRLRRAVGAELALIAVVLAASAVLVQTIPARNAGVEAAAAAEARGFATTLTSPVYSVQLEVFPAQVGPYNTLHAFVYAPDGRPARPVEWKVTGTLAAAGVEAIDNPIVTIRGNQGIGPVNFPLPGRWELRLTIRVSETEQATVSTTVDVG
jgi:copper transport protein